MTTRTTTDHAATVALLTELDKGRDKEPIALILADMPEDTSTETDYLPTCFSIAAIIMAAITCYQFIAY